MVHLRLAADVDELVKAHAEKHGLTFTAALEALARAGVQAQNVVKNVV
jgi:hypothetical protein